MDSFIAGFAYGLTSVIVGQPLDTIKTRMQAAGGTSSFVTAKEIYQSEGVKGLYRGGLPLVFGGAIIRSTQFGVYNNTLTFIRSNFGKVEQQDRFLGIFDYQVIISGFAGGVGRGFVEGPFEFIKVRRQVNQGWKWTEILHGSQATILRNSFLFCSFMIYIDLSKQVIPGGLGSFWTGAICSNMAWLTIWPLDVAKSQIQSGNKLYTTISYRELLRDILRKNLLFRGLLPGLSRSFIANGLSMVAYDKTDALLKLWHQRQ